MYILYRTKWFIIAFIVIMVFPNQGYTVERQSTFSTTLKQELSSITKEGTDTQTKVLIDGTTIIPSSGSSYSIKSFPETLSEDSNSEMVIIVNHGLVRVIGGYLNNKAPIIILTPSAKLTLDMSDVLVSVDENGVTRASMVYGKSLTMESGGGQEVIVKPGYELVAESANSPPKAAMKQEKEIIIASVTAAEFGTGSNNQERNADLSADGETISGATDDDKISTSLPDTSSLLPILSGSGSGLAGGSIEIGLAADEKSDKNYSELGQANGDVQGAHQEITCCTKTNNTDDPPKLRPHGLSTNRLYTSNDLFTQNIADPNTNPQVLINSTGEQAHYVFIRELIGNMPTLIVSLKEDRNQRFTYELSDTNDNAVILRGLDIDTNNDNVFDLDDDDKIIKLNSIATAPLAENNSRGFGNRFSDLANYRLLTTGIQTIKDQRSGRFSLVLRDPENFVILEVDSLDPGHENERYIFASGDVVSTKQSLDNLTVDQFFLTAGLNNYDQKISGVTRASDIRVFARDDSVINQNLGSLSDSGLLVVNHAASSNQPTRVLHADFSLFGTGSNQTSTISTTLGAVEYKITRSADPVSIVNSTPGPSPDGANDVLFNATTLGSTQGARILVSFNSAIFNTSAGGGVETLGSGPGYADYFVLENFDPNNPSTAGTEHAIGTDSSDDRQYAFLRLASIQSSTPKSELSRTQQSTNGGYAAGLVTTETGNNLLSIDYLLSGADPGTNLSINNNLTSSGLSVELKFNNGQSLSLGGSDNNAAFVDDDRFAATNGSATLVSAGLVESGMDNAIASKINLPEYMQWGFFFGDVNASDAGTSHAHLASWVAGSVPSAADLPVTGSATYRGSAIGNVFDGANSYVAAGTYTNTWDFAARTGSAQIQEFDGVNYTGITAIENNTSRFVGALANDVGSREVGLQGSFVQNAGDAAAGVMGQFYIQNTDSNTYRAAGTFAADKQ